MTYACDRCGFFEIRELEVGVEGPQHWRDDVTFIACAFTAGRCPECNNSMTHINFKGDVEYDSPREPTAKYVFRVPKEYSSYPTLGMHDDGTIIKTFADSAFLQWRAT